MVSDSDFVDNDEVLYRRIPSRLRFDQPLYILREDGTIKISSMAFLSRDFRISVDRAKLHDNNPRETQENDDDGVVSLLAKDVRNIAGLIRKSDEGNNVQFKVEVEPVPLSDNKAHAEIYAIPAFEYDSRKIFRKLCERLAQLAEHHWEILPDM
jgi:hypothetical protein